MMVCDLVVLANGCLDHLLDSSRRKTTAAQGRAVDGGALPGRIKENSCDALSYLDSCVRVGMNTN